MEKDLEGGVYNNGCRQALRWNRNVCYSAPISRCNLGISPLWFYVALDRQLELGNERVIGHLYFRGIG